MEMSADTTIFWKMQRKIYHYIKTKLWMPTRRLRICVAITASVGTVAAPTALAVALAAGRRITGSLSQPLTSPLGGSCRRAGSTR